MYGKKRFNKIKPDSSSRFRSLYLDCVWRLKILESQVNNKYHGELKYNIVNDINALRQNLERMAGKWKADMFEKTEINNKKRNVNIFALIYSMFDKKRRIKLQEDIRDEVVRGIKIGVDDGLKAEKNAIKKAAKLAKENAELKEMSE